MTYEHLYQPALCSTWPAEHLRAVGLTFREAAGKGLEGSECVAHAVEAYVAAGGLRAGAGRAVLDMIASLSAEHGDWLWGPAQEWRERQVLSVMQSDLFVSEARSR
jgi:hypothetical protein